jgi:DNA-binding MarR family transcriptional regulator
MRHTDALLPALQEWMGIFMRHSMHSWILYMRENELSISQIGALFQINHGRSNVSDLGEGLGISNAAASQMLERLVQQELIVRSEDPQDRRVKQLVLTDKGCKIIQESIRARQEWLKDLVSGLSGEEKEQIAAGLRVLIDRTNQLERQSESKR